MYIDDQGGIEGSITGGCVEGAVAAAAMEMLDADGPPQLVTYGISDELAGTVGLMCGGIVHIFIHELEGEARDAALLDLEAIVEHRPAALVTLIDGEHAGAKLFVDDERRDRQPGRRRAAGQERRARGRGPAARGPLVACATSAPTARRSAAACASTPSIQAEPPRMVVFGAIDFSSALAPLAKGLGYKVTIADPRSAFLALQALLGRRRDRGRLARQGPRRRRARPARRGAVFTHDPKLDVPAVQAALGTGAGYIGALGSRNTTADRNRRLRDVGVTRRRDRPDLRALRAGHRRLDRRGDGRRRARRDHRPRAPGATDSRCGRPKGPIRHADTTNEQGDSMAYTVCVTWIAKPGEEDAVASALKQLVEPSRAEEGVLVYIPNRDPEDPTKFFIYEQYVDEAAYTAHTETEHFKRLGFGDAIPRLLERKREFYAPMVS